MLLCRIFNIHSVVPAAVFALVMDIITVDRPILRHPVAAAQAPEIGVVIIRCHHTCAMALGAFHLNARGQGVVCTVCKVWSIWMWESLGMEAAWSRPASSSPVRLSVRRSSLQPCRADRLLPWMAALPSSSR